MKAKTTKPPEIHVGMPVIPMGLVPRSRNVYAVIRCDYRKAEATCYPLSLYKERESGEPLITVSFRSLIPLRHFGVLLNANTRLNIFAALPSRELPNRTHEIMGKTIPWFPELASKNAGAETQCCVKQMLAQVDEQYFARADEYV